VGQLQDRTLALAGIFQAARLAQQLAREGRTDPTAFGASIGSVLKIDADSVADVYGGVPGVGLGLSLLRDKLGGDTSPQDVELAKYVVTLIQLEAAFARRPDIAKTIQSGIRAAQSQVKFFASNTDDEKLGRLAEKLAELYTQTLSTLSPRVMITGEQGYLATPTIAARVRAALLAGVRSAVLWRQLRGRRWHLLVHRSKLAGEAAHLLGESRE
jgi:high frequency lysogenization protein